MTKYTYEDFLDDNPDIELVLTDQVEARNTLRALTIGYEALNDKRDWCQGDEIQVIVDGHGGARTQRCAVGAINQIKSGIGARFRVRAVTMLDNAALAIYDQESVVMLNDDSGKESYANVRAAYRWAIRKATQRLADVS